MKLKVLIQLIDKFDEAAQNYGYFAAEGSNEDAECTERERNIARKELVDKLVEAGVAEVKEDTPVPPPPKSKVLRKINW
jgi:hypothetical protein